MYGFTLERVLDFNGSIMHDCGLSWNQKIASSLVYSNCSNAVNIMQFIFLNSSRVITLKKNDRPGSDITSALKSFLTSLVRVNCVFTKLC